MLANQDPRNAVTEIYGLTQPKAIAGTLTRLRLHPDVKAALEAEGRARDLVTARHTPMQLEAQLSHLGFSDVGDLLDSAGNLKPIDSIPPAARAAIKGIKIRTLKDPDGNVISQITSIQLEGKLLPLKTIAELRGVIKPEHAPLNAGLDITIHMTPPPDWRGEPIDISPLPAERSRPPAEPDPADEEARRLYEAARRREIAEGRALEVLNRPQPRPRFAEGTDE